MPRLKAFDQTARRTIIIASYNGWTDGNIAIPCTTQKTRSEFCSKYFGKLNNSNFELIITINNG